MNRKLELTTKIKTIFAQIFNNYILTNLIIKASEVRIKSNIFGTININMPYNVKI